MYRGVLVYVWHGVSGGDVCYSIVGVSLFVVSR